MRFSAWYPAEEIAERAPRGEGVFQVRAAGLLQYPRGKSAMVHYEAAPDMQAAMLAWADAKGDDGYLYRHVGDLGRFTPAEALERVMSRFVDRFGSAPKVG